MKSAALMSFVWFSAIVGTAQSNDGPTDVVTKYCRLDQDGAQMRQGGWISLARMFRPDPPLQPSLLKLFFLKFEVISGFVAGTAIRTTSDRAGVTVHYSTIGAVDSWALLFTKSAKDSEATFALIMSPEHFDVGSDGNPELIRGTNTWRIKGYPGIPHVSIDAAILYISALRDDPTTLAEQKERANKLIAALRTFR